MALSWKLRGTIFITGLLFGRTFKGLTVEKARTRMQWMTPRFAPHRPVASVADSSIPGPAGAIPLRAYTPEGDGPFPLLLYFHGGGFVTGDLDIVDSLCRSLCHGARSVVVSVGYRLAPEHRFPAGSDDCFAAACWFAEHAMELKADPTRIAVAGDSSGANLAAVTALRCRDAGGPHLCGQVLFYPNTDYHTPPTPSYLAYANGNGFSRDDMIWFWSHYLQNEADAASPYASPLRAADLSGVAPALVITAEYDPLRDEGERYAERLQSADTPTVLSRYAGMIHGFLQLLGLFDESQQAVDEASAWLRERMPPVVKN